MIHMRVISFSPILGDRILDVLQLVDGTGNHSGASFCFFLELSEQLIRYVYADSYLVFVVTLRASELGSLSSYSICCSNAAEGFKIRRASTGGDDI